MDIPRIFNITESAHRIHNPFTPEKLATLGAALRLEPGTRVLDLGSGSGEMLCTWARDHGISGTGIDMSQLFTEQAKLRAEELGVADRVELIQATLQDTSPTKRSVSQPVSVPPGSVGGSPAPSNSWRRASAPEGSSSSANPIGGSYRRRKMLPGSVLPAQSPNFSCFQNFSRLSATSATTSWKWFWQTKTAGTGTRRPSGSPCADGSRRIPTTTSRQMFEPN